MSGGANSTAQSQSPSDRNKDAITEQLKLIFPATAKSSVPCQCQIFEVGSADGVHVLHFAKELHHVFWHPSDYNEATIQCHSGEYVNVVSILDAAAGPETAATQQLPLPSNVAAPIFFDVTTPIEQSLAGGRKATFDGVLNINMLHIAPWAVSVGLFRAAGYLLKPAGLLVLYGAFAVDGVLEPESNVQFDKTLREKNPEWGVRDVRDLKVLARENGLVFVRMVEMPSNNKILVFERVEQ